MDRYAIRAVLEFGVPSQDPKVFEERVVCFRAESPAAAAELAAAEVDEYASTFEPAARVHEELVACRLHPEDPGGEPVDGPADGQEVWSELYRASLDLEEFYRARYEAFAYEPD